MKHAAWLLLLILVCPLPCLGTEPPAFELVRQALPASDYEDGEAHMHYLRLPFLRRDIPLARSQILRDTNGEQVPIGFSPESLKLEWLIPSQLLWISWTTYSQGTGGFNFDGNVLVSIRYDSHEELFRDFFMSYARGGWWHSTSRHLSFSYDPKLNLLTQTVETEDFYADEDRPDWYSSLEINEDGETPVFESLQKVREIRTYHCIGTHLGYLSGYRLVRLDPKGFTPKKLADALNLPVTDLKDRNPQLKGRRLWRDWVVTETGLSPYQKHTDNDGLSGGF